MTDFKDLWVLLVEDDIYSQRMTQMMLRQYGVEKLETANNGAKALEMIKEVKGHYDLIVSDWNMPEVTGLDLLKEIREMGVRTKFLMLTSNAGKEFVLQAREHRVDAYIAKPFSSLQLKQKLTALFNIRPW
jgi:two-component system chemotaxis response regulator CheY